MKTARSFSSYYNYLKMFSAEMERNYCYLRMIKYIFEKTCRGKIEKTEVHEHIRNGEHIQNKGCMTFQLLSWIPTI